jgi:hypothetical protein
VQRRVGDRGVRRLRDHEHTLAIESKVGDRFAGNGLGGNDHVCRALEREVAQMQVHAATAQALAAAGERTDVVDGHDHWAGAVQHGPLDPRRVEDLGPARTVGLQDLVALAGRVAQRL